MQDNGTQNTYSTLWVEKNFFEKMRSLGAPLPEPLKVRPNGSVLVEPTDALLAWVHSVRTAGWLAFEREIERSEIGAAHRRAVELSEEGYVLLASNRLFHAGYESGSTLCGLTDAATLDTFTLADPLATEDMCARCFSPS